MTTEIAGAAFRSTPSAKGLQVFFGVVVLFRGLVARRQAQPLLYSHIRHAEMAFYELERGMLSEDRLTSALRPLLSDIDKPIFRSFWEKVGPRQAPASRDYLNTRIVERAGERPSALPDTR